MAQPALGARIHSRTHHDYSRHPFDRDAIPPFQVMFNLAVEGKKRKKRNPLPRDEYPNVMRILEQR